VKAFLTVCLAYIIAFAPSLVEAQTPIDFSKQTCEDYEARRARQLKLDQERRMHDRIYNLCFEPTFDTLMRDLQKEWDAFVAGFTLNPAGISNRIRHGLLSNEVYEIVNYPKLDQVLEECFPKNKMRQYLFMAALTYQDQAVVWGAVAGLATQVGIFRGGEALVVKFASSGRALKMYRWLFYPVAMGSYEMFQWSHIPVTQSSPQIRKVDTQNQSDPVLQRIEAAKGNTAAKFQPRLFAEPNATSPIDEYQDIVNFLRLRANACLNSAGTFLRAQSVGYGDRLAPALKANCKNYVTELRDGLERLQDKRYACLPTNRGAREQVLADFDVFLKMLPAEIFVSLNN
jgi:heme exporter protein D